MNRDLSIDIEQYSSLPHDVRRRLDDWLRAEALIERRIVKLTVGEGTVTIECCALDATGKPYIGRDGKIAMTMETVPVQAPPPADAFRGAGQ